MKYRKRLRYTDEQKAMMWDRILAGAVPLPRRIPIIGFRTNAQRPRSLSALWSKLRSIKKKWRGNAGQCQIPSHLKIDGKHSLAAYAPWRRCGVAQTTLD